MRALLLSGGGSRGAFQVGALKYLLEKEQDRPWYKVFYGSSIGAINAAFLSQFEDPYKATSNLLQLWGPLNDNSFRKHWLPLGVLHGLWKTSFYDTKPLKWLLDEHLHPEAIRDAGNKLRIGATSLRTGRYRLFTEQCANLRDAVLAASAFPVLFPPVQIDNQLWVDGGFCNTNPLKTIIEVTGVSEIDIITALPLRSPYYRDDPRSTVSVAAQVFDTLIDEILNKDIARATKCNDDCSESQWKVGKRFVKLRIVKMDHSIPGHSVNFDNLDVRTMIDVGYRSAKHQLNLQHRDTMRVR